MSSVAVPLLVLLVAVAWPRLAAGQERILDSGRGPDYLYALTAREGNFAGRTLTLNQVSLATLFFSDRPARVVGHMRTTDFVNRFSRWADQVDADPPNALLSILGGSGSREVVVELRNPKLDGDTLRWEKIRVLAGSLPTSFGTCSLFLEDAFGSPVLQPGRGAGQSAPERKGASDVSEPGQ